MKRDIHDSDKGGGSLRIFFEYEGNNVNMVKMERVAATPPPADPDPVKEGEAGFWYELQDAEGKTLYRRVTQNPIKFAFEVTTGEPDRPLAWKQASEVRGSFPLLVPDLEQATTMVLFSSPLEPARAGEPAKELSRFSLKEGYKGKGA